VFDPGSVYVGFVVDKVALGQGFSVYFGLPQSISFHQCSITRKMTTTTTTIIIIIIIIIISFIMRLHKKPYGCVASVASAAGFFSTKNLNHGMGFYVVAFPSNASAFCPQQAVSRLIYTVTLSVSVTLPH
jgi:hypothetical protein